MNQEPFISSGAINTRAAWRPVLRPVTALVIAAQLALVLQPLSALAQKKDQVSIGGADLPSPVSVQVQAPAQAAMMTPSATSAPAGAADLGARQKKAQQLASALLQGAPASDLNRAKQIAQLRAHLDAVKLGAAGLRAEFAATHAQLQKSEFPSLILTRHSELQAEFERRAAAFESAGNAWQADPSAARLTALETLLRQHAGASQRAPVDPGALPWGPTKSNRRLPAETKTAWQHNLHNDFYKSQGAQLAQAGLTTLGGIRFSQLPAPTEAPQDADLAETPDNALTPAIRAKAKELSNNPVLISNWVRNNVQFTPTWGAMQSADGTLRTLKGNAFDTASLQIALLRASGIPARYQFGTIAVPAGAAMNWLGGLQSPNAALNLLLQGGIAARGIGGAGQIQSIHMEHVWVSAYVNWSPSRGARDGGPKLIPPQHPSPNASLNAWVPLDASFKQNRFSAGMNLAELAPFSAQGALDAAKQGASCSASAASQSNQAALAAHYAQYKAQARQQLGALGADTPVSQILGTTGTIAENLQLLAGTLPHAIVLASDPTAELTAALRWKVSLVLLQGTDQVLSLNRSMAELEGQQLSLGFAPETGADAQALALLLRPGSGGDAATGLPGRIPAYLVKLKAQLRLNGQVVAEGGSFTLGQPLTLRTALQGPDSGNASSDAQLVAGETHAWSVQSQLQGAASPATVSARLGTLAQQLNTAIPPAGTEQAAQLLSGVASTWQASLDAKARLYQRVANVVEVRLPGIVRASSRLQAEQAFGLVTHVAPAGVGLHVDRHASAIAPRTLADAAPGYATQSLERADATAHQLLDRVFGPAGANAPSAPLAQSALSGLAFAAAQGQSVLRADAATLAQVLPLIDADSTVRAQVENSAANGMQALLAPSVVDLGGLPMDPLILHDPVSGNASYSASSRSIPVVQLTAQRPGLSGWLGLADAQASKVLVGPAVAAVIGQLNTVQTLAGDVDAARWQGFAGQDDLIDGLYLSRLSDSVQMDNACDWLISTLASQLGSGLPSTARVNRAPLITSQAVASAASAYRYAVQASDPDGDPLTYRLQGAPTGMSIDNAGLIQWPRTVAGQFTIAVQVSDGQATAEQRYTLTVTDAEGLQLNAALMPSIASAGQNVLLMASASASAGTSIAVSATLDGAALALDAKGAASFTAPAAGAHRILITASDGQSSSTKELILTVQDTADTAAPLAQITSPQADASLRGMVGISGTASDAHFAYYRLLLRPVGAPEGAWQEIGRGLSQVVNGPLGQIDTSTLANGLHEIALVVSDVNGLQSTASVTVEALGNLKLGQFRLSFADVRAEAPGLPLMLTRTYDSAKKDIAGDFGYGWSASGQDVTVRKNMTLGLGWQVEKRQFQLCLVPQGKRRISISLPDGGLYRFDAKNAQECAFGQVPEVDLQFTAVPGPTGGSSPGRVSSGGQLRVLNIPGLMAQGGILLDMGSEDIGAPWNPLDFELTTEEGFKYNLREGVGILSVSDPYGNRVDYGASGYRHSANLGISLARDSQGRITQATDASGKVLSYQYNAQGELASVTDREGKTTRFAYASVAATSDTSAGGASGNQAQAHLLASITDPGGQVVMRNQFDAYGRLTSVADASGQASQQQFDLAASQQTSTDRRGNRTVYTFDADGNITQVVNALGETSRYTFDANGNETSATNALGQTTQRTFDAQSGKQLSETNALGHTVLTSYPGSGLAWQRQNPVSTTDARGNTTGYAYADATQPGAVPRQISEPLQRSTGIGQDSQGNLRSLNVAGEVQSYSYDSQGRRILEANGLGNEVRYTFDASGNETSRSVIKTVAGQSTAQTTSKKYDSENRLIEETDPLGGKRLMTYNAAGKLASETDALGRKTAYSYDANARLIKTDYPDGTAEQSSYDAEGNETSRADRQGRVTRMDYDALNRLLKTTWPDGASKSTEYDAAGKVTASTDRKGQRTTLEYDAAGRVSASIDATGRKTSQTYDENGNRTSNTVAAGTPEARETSYEYDALNRLTRTTWPDGSSHSTIYRPDNRKQSELDARGVATAYGYDSAGRLTSVTQSLGAGANPASATTGYSYDETGAKTEQTDALGRSTRWSLDANGRITSRTVQDGSRESSSYDAQGNRLSKTTFTGQRLGFQYDAQDQLAAAIIPEGTGSNVGVAASSIAYRYTASGQLQSQQEQGASSLNGQQTYQYDALERLTASSGPAGQLSYSLDPEGNPVERSASNGTVSAGTSKSEYDAAGRLARVSAPDGKQTRYRYDAAGRLASTERDLNPDPASSQAQTLVSHQRYDAADRLIAIAHVRRVGSTQTLMAGQALARGAGGAISRIDIYRDGAGVGYDAATGQFTGAPAQSVDYEYDANARLVRESHTAAGASRDTRYSYDAAGNRTSRAVSSAAGTQVTSYSYDAADRLMQESTSLAGGGTSATRYEWDGNGNLAARLEADRATLYRWDARDRLIDIRTGATQAEAAAAAPAVSYAYDAAGNRVKKTVKPASGAAASTSYLVDNTHGYAQVALESTSAGATSAQTQSTAYVWGVQLIRQTRGTAGTLYASADAASDLFPLAGHLGTSLGALDADGNVAEQVSTEAFGGLEQAGGLKQSHLYAGEYWDQDSGLLYLRARWYDPKVGRFISADPALGHQRNPISLNRYVYANDDPTTNTDPTGSMTLGETVAVNAVAGQMTALAFGAYQGNSTSQLVSDMFWGATFGAAFGVAFHGVSVLMHVARVARATQPEVWYRVMSEADYLILQSTRQLPASATGETMISPTISYVEQVGYRGVLVEFEMSPGFFTAIEQIGVRDASAWLAQVFPKMPTVERGWMATKAFFKMEGSQTNVGLGKGAALDIFNSMMQGFKVILRP